MEPNPTLWNGTDYVRSPTLRVYDPAAATPPYTLVPSGAETCATLCAQSYGSTCLSRPALAGSCEYGEGGGLLRLRGCMSLDD